MLRINAMTVKRIAWRQAALRSSDVSWSSLSAAPSITYHLPGIGNKQSGPIGARCRLGSERKFGSLAGGLADHRSRASSQACTATGSQHRHFSPGPPGGPGGMNLGNIFAQNQNRKPGETLEQFGTDLTKMAQEGKLDPVIGRHEEIRRTLQILARRTKNNPVLIGEPVSERLT